MLEIKDTWIWKQLPDTIFNPLERRFKENEKKKVNLIILSGKYVQLVQERDKNTNFKSASGKQCGGFSFLNEGFTFDP